MIPIAAGPTSLAPLAPFVPQSKLREYFDVLSEVEPDNGAQPIEKLLDSFEIVTVLLGKKATGKGTIGNILAQNYNFSGMATSDWLRDIAESRGASKPFKPGKLRELADELRTDFGGSVLVRLTLQEYFLKESERITFDGLKSLSEFDQLVGRSNVQLVWVDAPDELRLERIRRRNRPGDPKTLAELLEVDKQTFSESAEFEKACSARIINNSDDLGALTVQVNGLMERLGVTNLLNLPGLP